MVRGAEFRAETHGLCSRVKSRNMQFPDHYPHMPIRGPSPGKYLELSSNSLILGTFWHETGLVIIMRSAMNYGN